MVADDDDDSIVDNTRAKGSQQDKGNSGGNYVKLPILSDRSGSSSDLAARTRALEQRVAAAETQENLKSTAPQCERQFKCYYGTLFKVEHFR
eukprot:m51a1_g8232 hypothetical protein (92) ;mRNA; f:62788-64735